MAELNAARVPVTGTWWRHIPGGSDPLYRPPTPADGRWQRGEVIEGMYLASDERTVWAEWYRWLSEHEVEPLRALPRDVWRYKANLEAADLTSDEALASVGLPPLEPTSAQWPDFQDAGEALHAAGYEGVLYRSASRPQALCVCAFRESETRFDLLAPIPPPRSVKRPPAPPRGLRT